MPEAQEEVLREAIQEFQVEGQADLLQEVIRTEVTIEVLQQEVLQEAIRTGATIEVLQQEVLPEVRQQDLPADLAQADLEVQADLQEEEESNELRFTDIIDMGRIMIFILPIFIP